MKEMNAEISTYIQPMLIMTTTAIFVFVRICKFQTIAVGIGMMIRSMNMLKEQLARMKARLLMHFPCLIGTPLASSSWSISGFAYA